MNKTEKYNYRRWTKWLNIAIIVVSSITILSSIAALIYVNFAYGLIQGNEAIFDTINNTKLGYSTSLQGEDFVIGNLSVNVYDLMSLGLSFFLTMSAFSLLGAIYSLIVSIWTYKSIKNASKKMFGVNIVSAALAFLSFNWIRCVLLIVGCVFIYKIKD